MRWTIAATATTRGGTFLISTTHLGGFAFLTAAATRQGGMSIFTATAMRSGSLGISAMVATSRNFWIQLGTRNLVAGHHMHVLRRQHIGWIPTSVTALSRRAKPIGWRTLCFSKSTGSLGGRRNALG